MKKYEDKIDKEYDPYLLPHKLEINKLEGFKIVLINTTTADSCSPVHNWLYTNYGIHRYQKISLIEKRFAYKQQFSQIFEGKPIFLTTGSLVDLNKQQDYPWVSVFRNTVLKKIIEQGYPILAPCFGLAQLAQCYEDDINKVFPKGTRVLGKRDIKFDSREPLFNNIKQMTGYCHHNGTVPWEFVNKERNIKVTATTKESDGKVLPAVLQFNSDATIGLQFHREILDKEAEFLYKRKVGQKINEVFGIDKNLLKEICTPLSVLKCKQIITKECMEDINIDQLEHLIKKLNKKGINIKQIKYAENYLDGVDKNIGYGYSQQLSYLFFDNFLKISLRYYNHDFE